MRIRQHVIALAVASACSIAVASAQTRTRIEPFVDVGAGVSVPGTEGFESGARIVSDRLSSEYWELFNDSFLARYRLRSRPLIDVGAGLVLRSGVLFGVAVTHQRDERRADVDVTLDHRDYHRPLTGRTTSAPLQRRDTAVHLSAGYAWSSPHVQVRAFGGPSRFSVSQDLMDGLSLEEVAGFSGPPFVTTYSLRGPTDVTSQPQRGSAWGYHAGADVAYYFGRHAGVGMLVRYSDSTVALADPLSSSLLTGYFRALTKNSTVEVDTQRLDVTAGLRLRF